MKKLLFLPLFLSICLNTSAQFSAELYFGELTCGYDSVLGDYYDVEIILDNRLAYPCAAVQFEVSSILIDSLYGGWFEQYNWWAPFNGADVTGYNMNVSTSGTSDYTFAGDFSGSDPDLEVNLGDTLTFNVNTPGQPFWLKTIQGSGTGNAISVTNNGATSGTIVWVPSSVGTYFYNCEIHLGMTGAITVNPAIPQDTSMVLALNLTLITIPDTIGVLTYMRFTNPNDSSMTCLSNFVYSDSAGGSVPTSVGPCLDLTPDIYDHNATICNGDSILLGGMYQTIAGSYNDTLMAMNGCDSIIRTALVVNATYEIWDTTAICSGDSAMLGNVYYSDAGTYYDSMQTVAGCDSVLGLELIVNALPVPSITQNGNDLTSSSASSYQWHLNGTELLGETSQSYTVIASGSYSVFVTDSNGCSGSSDTLEVTLVGLEEIIFVPMLRVCPNPMHDHAIIHFDRTQIKGPYIMNIFNHTGKKLWEESMNLESQTIINRNDLAPGIYLIELVGESRTLVGKFVIK